MKNNQHTIYTIGHSTRSWEELISLLQSFGIKNLVDIRHYPHSGKNPQFNKENFEKQLPQLGINYRHLLDLGGRRPVLEGSKNDNWHNASFRGYADYMESEGFARGLEKLINIAKDSPTAMMCAEAVWWRCHRSMVADALKAKGWKVLHIMALNKATEHPYTKPARVIGQKVYYHDEDLFT